MVTTGTTDNYNLPAPLPIQPEELETLRQQKQISVSQWASQFRRIPAKTANLSGRWSNDIAPFAVEPMDALSDVGTREVWMQKSAQSSGTEIGLNFFGRSVCEDPGPFLMVMPTEADARKRLRTRIKTMIEICPEILAHLTDGDIDKFNVGQETDFDNMFLFIAWAGSASALADIAVRLMILDEVAKYQIAVGQEAGSVDLARDRATTYSATSKIFAPSTPIAIGDLFDVEYEETDKRQWWCKCTFCKQRHIPKWAYVDMDKDSVRKLLSPRDYLSGECARYFCPHCEKRFSEMERWFAMSAGKWAPRDCTVDPDGRIIGKIFSNPLRGYHTSAMMLYPGFRTTSQLAAEWAKAQRAKKGGNLKPLQNFINSRLGEPWQEKSKPTDPDKLTIHISGDKSGIVPVGVQMLTVGIDVQLDHIWVVLLGWGYLSEVWLIEVTRLETGDTLQLENYKLLMEYLYSDWPIFGSDNTMSVRKVAIDSNYRGAVILNFCRQCSGVDIIPIRGDDKVKTRTFSAVKVAGGTMVRYDLNVDVIKDRIYQLLYKAESPGPGYFHLPSDITDEILGHLSSEEQKIIRGKRRVERKWVPKDSHLANHAWDGIVYGTFAAELAGAMRLRDPQAEKDITKRRVGQMQRFNR